jgi:hypothetical protein
MILLEQLLPVLMFPTPKCNVSHPVSDLSRRERLRLSNHAIIFSQLIFRIGA